MPAEFFLDTNVIVYAFDASAPDKQRRAKELMAGTEWIVSWQVIQEFSSVALHRFKVPFKPGDLRDYVALKLWPRCRVFPSETVFMKAIEIHGRLGFRYYDSLVIASALAGEARRLLSEDMQDGQKIGPLQIENPFG